jgi:predicted Na+-dependent transporter
MNSFVTRYSTSVVVLLSIVLGFLLPDIGLIWRPYLSFLLMFLMFLVSLAIEPKEIIESAKNYRVTFLALFMVLVFTPFLSLFAKPLFSPVSYVGTVLAFCAPSAVATAFWSGVFEADVAIALVISTTTSLLSIITVPMTMLVMVGAAVNVDTSWMMLNLVESVLIPMTAAFVFKKLLGRASKRLTAYSFRAELAIIVLLIWGSIAPGVVHVKDDIGEFASLNVFMLVTLGSAFATAYFLTRRHDRKQAITIGIAASVKNAALSLVIGTTMFGPTILAPLIANLIAQNLLLVPLKAFLKEG